MFSRIAVADQLVGAAIEVLLGDPHALAERRRRRLVEDAHATARTFCRLDPKEADPLILSAGTDCPNLAGRQGIGADAVFALQFGRRYELLDSVEPHDVAELGVAKLGRSDALLL